MATSAERMRTLRARRAAALIPVDGPAPRDPGELLAPAVEATIGALQLGEREAAAAQLCRLYASAIDRAENQALALIRLGPAFLRVLVALGGTPAARAGSARARPAAGQVAQLRAAHAEHPAVKRRGR